MLWVLSCPSSVSKTFKDKHYYLASEETEYERRNWTVEKETFAQSPQARWWAMFDSLDSLTPTLSSFQIDFTVVWLQLRTPFCLKLYLLSDSQHESSETHLYFHASGSYKWVSSETGHVGHRKQCPLSQPTHFSQRQMVRNHHPRRMRRAGNLLIVSMKDCGHLLCKKEENEPIYI